MVGRVDAKGAQRLMFETAPFVRISAVATQYMCPSADPMTHARDFWNLGTSGGTQSFLEADKYGLLAGRSFEAAATVSGLVANLLTGGTPAQRIPNRLYSLAYNRVRGRPNVLYDVTDSRVLGEASASNASQVSAELGAIAVSSNVSIMLNDTRVARPAALESSVNASDGV